jgi:hypothetical protein
MATSPWLRIGAKLLPHWLALSLCSITRKRAVAAAHQAVDQAQAQLGPGHQPGGGDQVAVIDDRFIRLKAYGRITGREGFG